MRKLTLLVTTLLMMTAVVHAEGSAPVYDADNYPPQFDGQPDVQGEVATTASHEQSEPAPSMNAAQRIARLEQRINNLQNSEATMRMSSLQNEVQTLRGQVEELTHQLQQVQTQQKTIYSDLDKRVSQPSSKQPSSEAQLEDINQQLQQLQAQQRNLSAELNKRLNHQPATEDKSSNPSKTASNKSAKSNINLSDAEDDKSADPMLAVTAKEQQLKNQAKTQDQKSQPVKKAVVSEKNDAQPNVEEEQQIYQTAYNYIKEKKYTDAVAALKNMLQKYPSGQFAANAHYWLGELYGLLNDNTQSAKEFSTVIKNYPDSPKISDAQLKLGMIQASELKWKEAKAAFKKVISKYPGTTSAKVAAEQLKQMRLAGH